MSRFSIWTDALDEKGEFDVRYTCDLDNSSPEINWDGAPDNTEAFALIVDDLDSKKGTLDPVSHWLIYRIPKDLHHLPAGIPAQESLPNGIRQGINSFGKLGYTGPCPPGGSSAHRYRFRLFALAVNVEIPPRTNRDTLISTVRPYVLETCEFFGHYQRLAQKAG